MTSFSRLTISVIYPFSAVWPFQPFGRDHSSPLCGASDEFLHRVGVIRCFLYQDIVLYIALHQVPPVRARRVQGACCAHTHTRGEVRFRPDPETPDIHKFRQIFIRLLVHGVRRGRLRGEGDNEKRGSKGGEGRRERVCVRAYVRA